LPGQSDAFDLIFDMARSAKAVIVSDGFTPGFADIEEPSQIYIFLYP
jgi:hypothetical protein